MYRFHGEGPLRVNVERGQLVIVIGVKTLAGAANRGPFADLDLRVTDPERFAHEVARVLRAEEEDGTTPVHALLDRAIVQASEQGGEGLEGSGDERCQACGQLMDGVTHGRSECNSG